MIVLDLLAAVLVLLGSLLCLGAAVSLVRFPDVLGKLHAITKPQVLGMTLICLGMMAGIRTWHAVLLATMTIGFQLLTAPVSASMVSRSAYRSGIVPRRHLETDDLSEDLDHATQQALDERR
ncbi:monovalent cation/H(+) antiporter subunit G [uncultured Tessaracoccus sp.]|uniref:monovalent cation/H(+) antiporter subunit G n=1 Tax=uncultured Tessaracoccus sp. TaxID=905023 RepID=UPI0025D04669|nr:monovalent cation/H(+) antiporter subunit G [uncultured Tessaracoccus sp.]